MPKDHFVSRVYLRQFADTDGRLNAYSKQSGKNFRPWPEDICRLLDDDLNPEIPNRPELLGDLRKIFEPQWTAVLAALKRREAPSETRAVVAVCFAHMMITVPGWRRVMTTLFEGSRVARLDVENRLREEHGKKDEQLASAVASLKEGHTKLNADLNSVKRWVTLQTSRFGCLVYHANWRILENDTSVAFCTSDNPVAFLLNGAPLAPVLRFLPITPDLGLLLRFDDATKKENILHKSEEEIAQLWGEEPRGTIHSVRPTVAQVKGLNRTIAQCTEDLVLSSRADEGIQKLTEKYSKYRIEADFPIVKMPDSYITGFELRVRPRTDVPK